MTEIIENIESFNKYRLLGTPDPTDHPGKDPKGPACFRCKRRTTGPFIPNEYFKNIRRNRPDRFFFQPAWRFPAKRSRTGLYFQKRCRYARRTDKSFQKSQNKINRLQNHSRRYLQAQTGLVQRSIAIQIRKLIGSCC